ncbi:hypothetical protein F0562_001104 [Nyssa sinensis]|uniref:Non-haem dioxygenase N-terminal domain-containing protein n=1 Tax=Nyssa sinensis TaxID=561372 RepID=A0A5J5C206_9ASTE|nr:hypothetical protein F0562_001104 [Nyssa sinensis]
MSKINSESYPPMFRPASCGSPINGVELDNTTKQSTDSDPLPVIDLQCIDHDKLGEVCKDWGMFRLVNHGIPVTLLNELQDQAKKLFSLTFDSKQALFTSPIAYFWGTPALTPSGVALQRGPQAQIVNWVEGFNVLLGQLPQLGAEDPAADSFRLLLEEYGRHQSRLATTIFQVMAENLKLGPKQSMSYLSPSTWIHSSLPLPTSLRGRRSIRHRHPHRQLCTFHIEPR